MMMTIDNKNMASSMLVQALLGVISSNFRMVAIIFGDGRWKVGFWLERDDEADREEIADAVGEFDALVLEMENPPSEIESRIEICDGLLPALDRSDWRIVFLRRE